MKLNPKQAPLYGECVLTVQLSEDECVEDEEDVEFYLLFSGTTQRHLTTTLRLGHVTLQAVCPAHDRDETVRVTLCQARPGGSVDPVAEERFQFVQDLALDMAQFLISAASHRDGLEGALLLADSNIPVQECERLDETLMLALKHLPLPPGWSVLGPDINTHTPTDSSPHETLLHFAARRGLRRVALFLLQQPGGHDALRLNNKHGDTPARVAQSRGHTHLQRLLSELEKSPHLEIKAPRRCHPAGRAFLHHPRLNTFTLTVQRETDGEPPDLRRDVDELRCYARAHGTCKGGSRKQRQSFPVILSRDFVDDLQTVAVTPSENPSLQKPPVCEHQEVDTQKESGELSKCPNGSARSEVGDAPVSGADSDSGKGALGLKDGGACAGEREDCAAVSAASCGDQQQEEVDSEPRVTRQAPCTHRSHAESDTKTHNKIQSGNKEEGTMGQNQGLLPENEEKDKARGDLPEEREGERTSSKQETFLPSGNSRTNGEKRSRFYFNLDVSATEKVKDIQAAGNANDPIRDQDLSRDLDSLSFRPNMAPGPVHNVRLETPKVLETAADQVDSPPETVSEQVSSDSVKEPPSFDDVTDAPGEPDRLALDKSAEEIQVDQTLLPETEQSSSSSMSENAVQSIICLKISEETSQIPTAHCGGQEPSQEHSEPQSDAKDSEIMDTMDQNQDPVRSQSPTTSFLTYPHEFMVSDFSSEETGGGLESKPEREPLAFQTPPESPCEFFSIDGLMRPDISIEAPSSASLEIGQPACSRETVEEAERVETGLLEMCESSKKSPVTILCGSFSKLTIRGGPLDPQPDCTPSETTEGTVTSALAGDSETSTAYLPEMEETKEELMKLEPKLTENSERSEPSQVVSNMTAAPLCDSVSEENQKGTDVITQAVVSAAPDGQDVHEACMKMPTKLGENPEISPLPCNTLSLSPSVSENVADPHSEVTSVESDKISEDLQSELMTSTETVIETSTGSHLEVSNFEQNILQKLDPVTFVESISGTSLELHHEHIISSEEKIVETSLDPFTEVRIPEGHDQDQQAGVITSNESVGEPSLGLDHDFCCFVEKVAEESLGPPLEVNSLEESTQVQQFESINDPCDLKLKVMSSYESIRRTLDFQHDLTIRDESYCPLPEVNVSEEKVLHQPLEALEENVKGACLDLNNDLPMPFEETIGMTSLGPCPEVTSSQENVLDQRPEVTTCETGENGTSQDHKPEVITSVTGVEGPQQGETALNHHPVFPTSEESVRETPDHNQPEEATCEKSLGICMESLPEDTRLPEAPVQTDTGILDAHVSDNDSGLALEKISTSDSLRNSDPSVDLSSVMDQDSGTGLEMDADTPEETDSGLIQDLASVGFCKSVETLDEEDSHTREERGEEPKEKQVAGDDGRSDAVVTHTDRWAEIHREEEEVLYSLESEDLKQECRKDDTQTDVPLESVCRSVSATSLPGSESISDGDSLLGPDTMDNSAFKQNEDSLTLTSGISMTGSVSTDDSSITHAMGEPEEEEKKDRLSEVLERSAILRSPSRSHSPSRRHSWEPSKNPSVETDMGQRSVVEAEEGDKPTPGHRRSMSWCPSHVPHAEMDEMNSRSYSLEGLAAEDEVKMASVQHSTHSSMTEREERGSLASLTEEENESNAGDNSSLDSQKSVQDVGCGFVPPPHTLTKSMSMSAISPRDLDDLPCLTGAAAAAGALDHSITEEDPAPLRTDFEVKGTKVSRTFSYLKSKMSKKSKEKDRDKNKDGKEKEKKSSNSHLFLSPLTPPPSPCLQCNRPISTKEALTCTNCNVYVHKGCRDALPVCAKVKMKQQTVTDGAPPPGGLSRGKSASARERPWSSSLVPEDPVSLPVPPARKNPSIMAFNSGSLSKSISISNIAGQTDDAPLKPLKILSQSTDSLNKLGKVNESTESLTDEGAELMDSHLMVEFEADVRELEADSWSFTVDKKYLKQQKKEVVKRQDVIYELIQTEMHHLRTLRIMADVYSKGLQKEVQVEVPTLEKMFPVLEELLELHTHFLTHLLERRREAREEQQGSDGGFVIRRIGDVLLSQVTGSNAENIKKVYGKFCSRHNEAVNIYKELHTRDKRFQAFIKRKMSSAVVRRLSIPECILLVTQRITKYPVLLQRLLQHTREPEEEADVAEALRQVKEVLTGVDSRVNEYEKRKRLKEVYSRTDSKSIMRMKSGQMFAREDLVRGRKLLHDGPLQLKNAAGRLKDVQALLLSDVIVFLQEKDQKYVFASLDQRSTVISLQKLIVREVANEERGLFFITAGIEKPEMVEAHASSKDERNTWMQLIQNATTSTDKDDDEGIPSENEEDKRLQGSKTKETREQLQKKDEQIVTLLEEKVRLFRELCDCANQDEASFRNRMLFRATSDDVTKGEPIMKDALKEVETLQELVNGGVMGQQVCVGVEDSSVCAGSVSLPRRAETFGGFDCHQINISKNGDREEADDLRRTESDSVLKKGGTANLLLLHKRNSEVLQSVTRLHDLLNTLQAVVVQQDTFIEEQRQVLSSPSLHQPSISSSSSISSLSSCSSRPSSLMEQEKQRQEEKIREEERRRREEDDRRRREEEEEMRMHEEVLALREERLVAVEEETQRRRETLQQEQEELSSRKEEYQRELLRLRDDQRRLEREREQLHTHSLQHHTEDWEPQQRPRTSSTASEDSLKFLSSTEAAEGVEIFSRADSKRRAKTLMPFSSGSGQKGGATEQHGQIPTRLLQLAKTRDKKEKKKKKGKGGQQNQATEAAGAEASGPSVDKDVYFC